MQKGLEATERIRKDSWRSGKQAYGQSKTANIWTANYVDHVFGPRGVHALAVHPDAVCSGRYSHADLACLKNGAATLSS
jgi:hypothetical protein